MKSVFSLLFFCTVAWNTQAAEATYRYFRFTPTLVRGGASVLEVQLSEFEMRLNRTRLNGATATNPGGNNPVAETPNFAVDGVATTKWLDRNKLALVVDFGAPVTANTYRFATANDATGRDPVSWTLEGSADNSAWTLLDTRTNYPTPTDRYTFTGELPILGEPVPPLISRFVASPVVIVPGEETLLSWDVFEADAVTITPEPGAVGSMGSMALKPATDTTYLLTASNPAGDVSLPFAVRTLAGAGSVEFRYFRFTPLTLRYGAVTNRVQLSEFEVLFKGNILTGASASNPGGDNPATETPNFAVDGLTTTKWMDRNKGPLILDFGAPVVIDRYRFFTANDATERDPVGWTFEGSLDGAAWIPIDAQNAYPVSTQRFTSTGTIPFLGTGGEMDGFRILRLLPNGVGTYALTWRSRAGGIYYVYGSEDLVTWEELADSIPATGQETTHTVPAMAPDESYFRVEQIP